MSSLEKKEKELLEQLKEAGRPANFFSLKLEYNGKVIISKRDFSADGYSPETIEKSRMHFMMVDFVRQIQDELRKDINKTKEEEKKTEMDKLWKQIEQKK